MVHLQLKPAQEAETKNQTAALFVSLYLVVLAFFILLNSISHIESKRKSQAIGSVRDTFSMHPLDTQPKLHSVNQSGTELPLNSYFTPIQKLAQNTIQLVDSRIINDGKKLELTINMDEIFFPYSDVLKNTAEDFLVKLAGILASPENDKRIDLEGIFNITLEYDEAFGEQITVKRASQIVRMLGSLGVDKRNLFFGVTPSPNSELFSLIFTERVATESTTIERIPSAPPVIEEVPTPEPKEDKGA